MMHVEVLTCLHGRATTHAAESMTHVMMPMIITRVMRSHECISAHPMVCDVQQ
jgi:hypothetical protein